MCHETFDNVHAPSCILYLLRATEALLLARQGDHRMSERGYGVEDFCRTVGISRSTFYALQHEGIGPQVTKVGKRLNLITHEATEQWLRDRSVQAAKEPQAS
jgi:predicted DNA-binding transcriptional regulator AlpA